MTCASNGAAASLDADENAMLVAVYCMQSKQHAKQTEAWPHMAAVDMLFPVNSVWCKF